MPVLLLLSRVFSTDAYPRVLTQVRCKYFYFYFFCLVLFISLASHVVTSPVLAISNYVFQGCPSAPRVVVVQQGSAILGPAGGFPRARYAGYQGVCWSSIMGRQPPSTTCLAWAVIMMDTTLLSLGRFFCSFRSLYPLPEAFFFSFSTEYLP